MLVYSCWKDVQTAVTTYSELRGCDHKESSQITNWILLATICCRELRRQWISLQDLVRAVENGVLAVALVKERTGPRTKIGEHLSWVFLCGELLSQYRIPGHPLCLLLCWLSGCHPYPPCGSIRDLEWSKLGGWSYGKGTGTLHVHNIDVAREKPRGLLHVSLSSKLFILPMMWMVDCRFCSGYTT